MNNSTHDHLAHLMSLDYKPGAIKSQDPGEIAADVDRWLREQGEFCLLLGNTMFSRHGVEIARPAANPPAFIATGLECHAQNSWTRLLLHQVIPPCYDPSVDLIDLVLVGTK